jgi:hypothetical protein
LSQTLPLIFNFSKSGYALLTRKIKSKTLQNQHLRVKIFLSIQLTFGNHGMTSKDENKDNQRLLPHRIYKRFKGKGYINRSSLADSLDLPQTCMYHYDAGRIRWPADAWLKVMFAIGKIEENEDGELLLNLGSQKELKELRRNDYSELTTRRRIV